MEGRANASRTLTCKLRGSLAHGHVPGDRPHAARVTGPSLKGCLLPPVLSQRETALPPRPFSLPPISRCRLPAPPGCGLWPTHPPAGRAGRWRGCSAGFPEPGRACSALGITLSE